MCGLTRMSSPVITLALNLLVLVIQPTTPTTIDRKQESLSAFPPDNSAKNGLAQNMQMVGFFTKNLSAGAEGTRFAVRDINAYNTRVGITTRISLSEAGETHCNPSTTLDTLRNWKRSPSLRESGSNEDDNSIVLLAGCLSDCRLIASEAPHGAITMCYGITSANQKSSQDESSLAARGDGDDDDESESRWEHKVQIGTDSTSTSIFSHSSSFASSGSASFTESGLFLLQPDFLTVVYPLAKFVANFGWRKVAVVHHHDFLPGADESVHANLADHLSNVMAQHGVQVGRFGQTRISPGGGGESRSMEETMQAIQIQNYRIIMVIEDETTTSQLLCHSFHRKMFDAANYVWFFIGPTEKEWFLKSNLQPKQGPSPPQVFTSGFPSSSFNPFSIHQRDCNPQELREAADGHFTVQPMLWNLNENAPTLSNRSPASFKSEMYRILMRSGEHVKPDFDEGALAYDAVWAAYAAQMIRIMNCQREGSFPCTSGRLEDQLNDLRFSGMSGEVSFYQGMRSVRSGTVKIERYKSRTYEPIAYHFNFNNSFSWIKPTPFGITPGDGFEDGNPTGKYPPPPLPSEDSSGISLFVSTTLFINSTLFLFVLYFVPQLGL